MWELHNRTPYAVGRTFVRDREGAEVLLVVVKATYRLQDGGLCLAEEQQPLRHAPRHASDDPVRSSLRYDSDFAPSKAATDVLLLGHARARQGRPAAAVEVTIRVGDWSKRLLAVGERRYRRRLSGWRLSDPVPFVAMPLIYERAYGGRDVERDALCEANPVGIGFPHAPEEGDLAPNLQAEDDLGHLPTERSRSLSFGPVARHWPLRRRFAGTFDDRWRRERRPLVPDDFDDAFHQSAPRDQQVALAGGEPVELRGVSPSGTIAFTLPRLGLSGRSRLCGELVEHDWSLHTVLFEPDHERVTLVAQSALPCHHELHGLEGTVVEEAA